MLKIGRSCKIGIGPPSPNAHLHMSTKVVPTVAFSGAAIHGVIVVRTVWEVEVRLKCKEEGLYQIFDQFWYM